MELKEILNAEEAAEYTGFKKPYVYRLAASGQIKAFKPGGKKLFFCREDLRNWILTNKKEVNHG